MAEPRTCGECGMPLPARAPEGLCPRCLVGMGLHWAPAEEQLPADEPGEHIGDRIGPYRLLETLGQGGYGIVYMAEQVEPLRRQVALKILKPGMDTRQVVARFEAERQALALMTHPNIAKVLDGGATAAGRPFFVLELVTGVKITEYCDTNRLTLIDRLGLFSQVCHAIQHAHQKGIIHRDIKPSNLLVSFSDGRPVLKVIDFGIAKVITGERLSDKTFFTTFQQLLGTPAYMSPEQAEPGAMDIDTRADIYSLGVLLYELLTGRTPFHTRELSAAGLEALRLAIRDQEPLPPSKHLQNLPGPELAQVSWQRAVAPQKLLRLVSGDLDWVVLRALEKDRTHRYASVETLDLDVRRYVAQQPVLARPPSHAYRFTKLVRRNRVPLIATIALALVLVLGATLAIDFYVRERQAHRLALALEQENKQVLGRPAAEVEKARDEVDAGHRAATLARVRANWWLHARQERWQSAAADFRLVLQLNPSEQEGWFILAALLLQNGDLRGYGENRQGIIARFNASTNHSDGVPAALACLLAPGEPDELQTAISFADAAIGSPTDEAWSRLAKALLEYRQGHFPSSIDWTDKILAYGAPDKLAGLAADSVLAMARFRLQQSAEVEAALCNADEIAKNIPQLQPHNLPRENTFQALTANLLRQEAQNVCRIPERTR